MSHDPREAQKPARTRLNKPALNLTFGFVDIRDLCQVMEALCIFPSAASEAQRDIITLK